MNLLPQYVSLLLFPVRSQSVVGVPASAAPPVSQSHLQRQSRSFQGSGRRDPPVRVRPHPQRADGSTARSSDALQPQPAPRAAAADQGSSGKISQLLHVRLTKNSFVCSSHTFERLESAALASLCLCSHSDAPTDLREVLSRIEAQPWLATEAQRCPLVRAAYLGIAHLLRGVCSETFLMDLSETVARDLEGAAKEELQVRDRHSRRHGKGLCVLRRILSFRGA